MGAISQEGMERELQNMHQGTLNKARSGRVTAKTPNYGYIFVDAQGKETPKVKKETYYVPHPEEAEIIELIYTKIAVEHYTTRGLATWLEGHVPAPRNYRHWEARQIALFIQNPVYKGQFVANRWEHTKQSGEYQRPGEPVKLVPKSSGPGTNGSSCLFRRWSVRRSGKRPTRCSRRMHRWQGAMGRSDTC